jgi:cysteine desulfurase
MAIYFDNNATTRPYREVVESMLPFLQEQWGNASSLHAFGRRARQAVEEARESVAQLLGCAPAEILFTGGGTEGANLALLGASRALRSRGRHLVTSAIEHHAVLNCAQALEGDGGRVTRLPVDASAGCVRPADAAAALAPDTVLASVMHANNETGAIQPIAEMAAILRPRGIVFHTDAVQTAGRIRCRVDDLGVDLLTLSAHKMHGPKGVGALYVRRGTALAPVLHGGAHEQGLRPGTLNVPGIAGLGAAARLAHRSLDEDAAYVGALVERLAAGIRRLAPGASLVGDPARRLPNTLTVCFPDRDNRSLVANLDILGVAVSSGAACTSGQSAPSHVLQAMGLPEALARGAVRFSLASDNTEAEVDAALAALKQALRQPPAPTQPARREAASAPREAARS